MGRSGVNHAEPVITHVYPPNSKWINTSGFRKYVNETIGDGKNGDAASPLDLAASKLKIDMLFESTRKELARKPFTPDPDRPLFIEKVVVYYKNQTEIQKRDYVFVHQ